MPGPGSRKTSESPTPGTAQVGKCPAVARGEGDRAQLELTGALPKNEDLLRPKNRSSFGLVLSLSECSLHDTIPLLSPHHAHQASL